MRTVIGRQFIAQLCDYRTFVAAIGLDCPSAIAVSTGCGSERSNFPRTIHLWKGACAEDDSLVDRHLTSCLRRVTLIAQLSD
jgi:hypothetical protein